jgi:hypothetical protein
MSTTNEPLNPPSAICDVRVSKFRLTNPPSRSSLTIVRIAMPAAPRLYCNVGSVRTLDNSRYLLLRLWKCYCGRDGVVIQVVWVHVSLQEHWVVRQSPSVGVVAEGCSKALYECGVLSCNSGYGLWWAGIVST